MTTYRVTGTADSILASVLGLASPGGSFVMEDDIWIHAVYGRNVYAAGLDGRHSHASIWSLVTRRSSAGGWLIFQDNGLATSESGWEKFMDRLASEIPDGRSLYCIPPAFHPDWSAPHSLQAETYAAIMREKLSPSNVAAVVSEWDFAVRGNRKMVSDGQHPTGIGISWLLHDIFQWTRCQPTTFRGPDPASPSHG